MKQVNVPKSIWNIAASLGDFFPDKVLGVDYSIEDHGGNCFVVLCEFDLPALDDLERRSKELALTARVAQAMVSIDQFHAEKVQALVGSPTQVEKDTWALKLETANAIANKTPVSVAGQAFLQSAGMSTDAAKAAWAASVLAKSAAYAAIVGLAERLRDAARTAVKLATDEASIKVALDAQRAAADAAVARLLKGT
jgi:hypothetical protein